jgi:multidrug efflux pump subunit AcrB
MSRSEKFILSALNSKTHKLTVIFITLLLLVGSIAMIPTKLVLAKMLPGKSANTFSIYVDTPVNSSIHQTKSVTSCITSILQKEQEIQDIEVFLGQGSPLDYAGLVKGSAFKNSENVAEIVVNLTQKHNRNEQSFLMVQRLRPILQKQCSLYENTSIKMIEQPAGPPVLASIVAELYAHNYETLNEIAQKIANIFKTTNGLVDVDIMSDERYKKFELVPNVDKILRSALMVDQVNKILYLAFEGMGVAVKNSQNSPEQIPLFVTLSQNSKALVNGSKQALANKLSSLKLMNQKGMLVPLSEVIDIKEVFANQAIMRKNLVPMVNVLAQTDMVSQVYPLLEAREKIIKKFEKEYEVTTTDYLFNLQFKHKQTGEVIDLKWDGEMKVTLDTFKELGLAFIAALVLIFLLMVIYYKSFTLSGIVLMGSFLSIIGVIIGHFIADLVTEQTFFLTATSLIGFIALMGISSRNSILLIDFTKSLINENGMQKRQAIAHATAVRAKPILLTALAIILGSALLATDPVFGGLGVALIFGTIAAFFVSIIFVPMIMDSFLSIKWQE